MARLLRCPKCDQPADAVWAEGCDLCAQANADRQLCAELSEAQMLYFGIAGCLP